MNSRVKLENLALKKEWRAELLLTNNSLNRKEIIIIEKCLDIKQSHQLSANSLINRFRVFLVKKELYNLGLNKILERYVSINELECIRKLNKLSHNTFKKLPKLQQITNYDS